MSQKYIHKEIIEKGDELEVLSRDMAHPAS